jgi:Zn-dependent protease
MRGSLNLGKIFGIRVLVHFSFLLVFIYVGYYTLDSYHSVSKTLYMFLVVLLVFVSVLMHEFGHALAARRIGIKTRQIIILPIGGMAQIDGMPEKPKDELFVTICGPLVNLAIVAVLLPFALIQYNLNEILLLQDFGHLLPDLITANIFLFIFNLVPAFPMDGGRILRALLALKLKYKTATLTAVRIGQAIAIAVILFSTYLYFTTRHLPPDDRMNLGSLIKFIILSTFILIVAEMEYRMVKSVSGQRSAVSGQKKGISYQPSADRSLPGELVGQSEILGRQLSAVNSGPWSSDADFSVETALSRVNGNYGDKAHNDKILQVTDTIAEAVTRFNRLRGENIPVNLNGEIVGLITSTPPVSSISEAGTSIQWSSNHTYNFQASASLGHALSMMEILDIPALALSRFLQRNGVGKEFYLVTGKNRE